MERKWRCKKQEKEEQKKEKEPCPPGGHLAPAQGPDARIGGQGARADTGRWHLAQWGTLVAWAREHPGCGLGSWIGSISH